MEKWKMKLNLGSGHQPLDGYINVDKCGHPDVLCDLEQIPWPWETNSAEEINMSHILEHLGQTPTLFIQIIQEIYRVLAPNGILKIKAPWPLHVTFFADPTHVRPITAGTLRLFDQDYNKMCREKALASSTLGQDYHVDFAPISEPQYHGDAGYLGSNPEAHATAQYHVSSIVEFTCQYQAKKPERFPVI
jgi:hypothetical protein